MLIISRRENEKFLFPNLGISVQLIKVGGKVAKIGIDAPKEIRVLREEIADQDELSQLPAIFSNLTESMPLEQKHEIRNQLNPISLGLQVAQELIEAGEIENLDKILKQVVQSLKQLDADLLGNSGGPQLAGERLANVIVNANVEDDVDDAKLALVVDDNANERSLLCSLLELSGFAVVTVEDGMAAIDYLHQTFRKPDFVLLDMNMPRMNGAETINEIRRDPQLKGLRVFAVSGCDQADMNVNLGPNGVDRWFTKPVDVKHLVEEMDRELVLPN